MCGRESDEGRPKTNTKTLGYSTSQLGAAYRLPDTIKSWNAYPNSGQRDHSTGSCLKASFTSILLNKMRVMGTDGRRKRSMRQITPRNTCPYRLGPKKNLFRR